MSATPPDLGAPPLPAWQRLAVRLATAFALVTLITVGLLGVVIHERQKREVEDTVGTQLLNISRTAVLLIDPAVHAEAQRTLRADSQAYRRIRKALAAVKTETVLTTTIRTLANYDPAARTARVIVTSDGTERPGETYHVAPELAETLAWSFEDGVARYTGIYRSDKGVWISAFAPIVDRKGRAIAVLEVDYPLEIYFDRLRELDTTIIQSSLAAALCALVLGLLFARRLTRPISRLTGAVAHVAAGDLSQPPVPVRSSDELGRLTRSFNDMVEGLRQRDFIRNAFGRYVSPEVARTLLESPDGLRLGGHKREITVLMSDLRGYTRFAEHGDPAGVMDVLNDYLGRMADIVIEHGGTINEFIGDAIFAVFGAPVEHADHAERAAAAALAMQRAMEAMNEANAERGRPRFGMGIGIHTGEAVVGNIGSEQRTKYAVVGAAVNLAARVEGCTVGGQILITAATVDRLGALAEVAPPITADLKGLDAPVALYELRGIGGRFAQRLADAADGRDVQVTVALPLTGAVFDGKRAGAAFAGTVQRLGRRTMDAALDVELPELTNVRLRLTFPGGAGESADVYAKVTGRAPAGTQTLTTIHFTSLEARDETAIADLVSKGVETS
ncbi:MAG TPA: adenylate/guanylate cyclase domain-containing protein [Methylomirabilota bacterium]|jgi:class 3 adenylate cyclase|nr:adenylate/guanylate cyclase domain-containing protein [Methylomirabilota bacterium]